jgi:nitrogen fixation protein NifU and related proteins
MTEKLSALYDDVIMDHIKNVRNYRVLPDAQHRSEILNVLCGDKITVYVKVRGELIEDAGFQCSCCGISMASASIMTDAVRGKRKADAKALSGAMTALFAGREQDHSSLPRPQAALVAAARAFPSRKTCAALAWHGLTAALDDVTAPVEIAE